MGGSYAGSVPDRRSVKNLEKSQPLAVAGNKTKLEVNEVFSLSRMPSGNLLGRSLDP